MGRVDKKNPDKLIQRHLIMEYIHTNHTPDELEEMVNGTKFVEELFDDQGEPALFFDWEFMLFEAPLPELDFMAQKLYNKVQFAKKKEELVSGIVGAQVQNEIDKRKHQGLTMTADEILEMKINAANADHNPIVGLVDKYGKAMETQNAGLRVHKNEDNIHQQIKMEDTHGMEIRVPTKVATVKIPEVIGDDDIKEIISLVYPAEGLPEEINRVIAYFISIKDPAERKTALFDYLMTVKEGQEDGNRDGETN